MNLVTIFDRHIDRLGAARLLVFQEREYTNMEINDLGRKLACGLRSLGFGRGDHIVVCLPNIPEVLPVFQAIWRIGAVSVPVMFRLEAEELGYILRHSDAVGIITSVNLVEKIARAKDGIPGVRKVILIGNGRNDEYVDFQELVDASPKDDLTAEMDKDDVAQIIYTSGTTGKPKGVMLTHSNLYSNAINVWEAFEWKKGPVALLCLPLAHAFGVSVMSARAMSTFKEGYDVLMPWFDPEEVFQLIERYRVNQFNGVPTMYQMLLDHPAGVRYDTGSLELCTVGGAPMSPELHEAFTRKFRCQIFEGYGMTETSPGVTTCRPSIPLKKGCCGHPYPGVQVKVVDEKGTELQPYEKGEILVSGPNVMKGYYKMPAETSAVLKGGWLHTGDIGYLDEDGGLYIAGRIKELIIKGGYNIYPKEVEAALQENPAIQEVSVVGVPHQKYGEDVVAFAVLREGYNVGAEDLLVYARSKISKFKCPSAIYIVQVIPKTATGKVKKEELKEMLSKIK